MIFLLCTNRHEGKGGVERIEAEQATDVVCACVWIEIQMLLWPQYCACMYICIHYRSNIKTTKSFTYFDFYLFFKIVNSSHLPKDTDLTMGNDKIYFF